VKQHSLIALALVLAALVTFVVARALGLVGTGSSAAPRTTVVAATTIGAGQPIQSTHIKLVPWPADQAPEGVFDKASAVVGRVVRQTIYPGELLLEPKLAPMDARGGLSATIENGKRAISVKVNEVIGVAGFALPGSYVDVLVSAKDQANQPFSTTVLSRIKVLAAAQETQSSQADQTKPKTVNAVTLELTPGEAEKLDLARSIGSLSLVLRNDSDTGDAETGGTRLNHILRGEVAAAPAGPTASAPARPRVNSTQRSEVHGAITSIRGITRREELP
jgi:pilus assembly protein CpaB